MAEELRTIHTQFLETIRRRSSLQPVQLKHPLPERPGRALGLLKIDGSICQSREFMRVMVLTTGVAFSRGCTRSIFLGPRPELYLPIFSSETILMGGRRAFLVDIHPTVRPERWDELGVEQRLLAIRSRYPELTARPIALAGKINDIMSAGHVYVQVPDGADSQAIALFNDYLNVYLELVDAAAPAGEAGRQKALEDFDQYRDTVINHDPAVKLYCRLFGRQGGLERVHDIFFGR